jgi:hypothetical protein
LNYFRIARWQLLLLGGILFSASVLDFACGGSGGGGGAGTNLGPIGVTMMGIPSGADTVHHPTAQAEIYNPSSGPLGAFTSLTATMVQARAAADAVLLKDGSVLFTGGLIRGAGPAFRVIINSLETLEGQPIEPNDYLELDFTIPGQQITSPPVCNGTTTACTNTSCTSCVCYTTDPGGTQDTVETIASSLYNEINITGAILATAGISATIDSNFGNVIHISESGDSATTSTLTASVNPTPVIFSEFSESETISIPESASFSAERFSPISQTFSAVHAMNSARVYHTTARLNNGTVLVAGGAVDTVPLAPNAGCGSFLYPSQPPYVAFQVVDTAEIYNPGPQTFSPTGNLNTARASAGSAVLGDGTVLIAGGIGASGNSLSSVEIYNPSTGEFTPQHDMSKPRTAPIVTVLDGGGILIAGGDVPPNTCAPYAGSLPSGNTPFTWEIYDPVAGSTTFPPNPSAPMSLSSESFAASSSQLSIAGGALLLLSGGIQPDENTPSFGDLTTQDVESYTSTINSGLTVLNSQRAYHQMTVLDSGKVLITGGVKNMLDTFVETSGNPVLDPLFDPSAYLNSAELYDDSSEPATSTPIPTNMHVKRALHSAIKLLDGTVLIAGGYCCGATAGDPDFECTPSTQCP